MAKTIEDMVREGREWQVAYKAQLKLDEQVKKAGFDEPFFCLFTGRRPDTIDEVLRRMEILHRVENDIPPDEIYTREWRNYLHGKIRGRSRMKAIRAHANYGIRTDADRVPCEDGKYWTSYFAFSLN